MNEPALYSTQKRDESLSDMTKTELIAYAEKLGVEGVSGAMKKADIITAIEDAL